MWHYECNGQSVGPVSDETIDVLIKDGVIKRETVVWKQGMDDWAPAEQTDLRTMFATPPPLQKRHEPESHKDKLMAAPADLPTSNQPFDEEHNAEIEPSNAYQGDQTTPPYAQVGSAAKPLNGVYIHSRIAVVAYLFASAAVILSYLVSIDFIQGAETGRLTQSEINASADFVDSFSVFSNLGFLVVFIWSAIVIGRWTYRAMSNLRKSGITTTVSPGWAVGWHFIPIALLWMPFRGMAQIWRGSISSDALGNTSLPVSMRFWWAAWIIGNSVSFMSFRMEDTGLSSGDWAQVKMGMAGGIVASTSHMLAAFLLLGLMRRVSVAQDTNPAAQFS